MNGMYKYFYSTEVPIVYIDAILANVFVGTIPILTGIPVDLRTNFVKF